MEYGFALEPLQRCRPVEISLTDLVALDCDQAQQFSTYKQGKSGFTASQN